MVKIFFWIFHINFWTLKNINVIIYPINENGSRISLENWSFDSNPNQSKSLGLTKTGFRILTPELSQKLSLKFSWELTPESWSENLLLLTKMFCGKFELWACELIILQFCWGVLSNILHGTPELFWWALELILRWWWWWFEELRGSASIMWSRSISSSRGLPEYKTGAEIRPKSPLFAFIETSISGLGESLIKFITQLNISRRRYL